MSYTLFKSDTPRIENIEHKQQSTQWRKKKQMKSGQSTMEYPYDFPSTRQDFISSPL